MFIKLHDTLLNSPSSFQGVAKVTNTLNKPPDMQTRDDVEMSPSPVQIS